MWSRQFYTVVIIDLFFPMTSSHSVSTSPYQKLSWLSLPSRLTISFIWFVKIPSKEYSVEKKSNLIVEKYYLNHMIKVNINGDKSYW